jgi:hypothetical protein
VAFFSELVIGSHLKRNNTSSRKTDSAEIGIESTAEYKLDCSKSSSLDKGSIIIAAPSKMHVASTTCNFDARACSTLQGIQPK